MLVHRRKASSTSSQKLYACQNRRQQLTVTVVPHLQMYILQEEFMELARRHHFMASTAVVRMAVVCAVECTTYTFAMTNESQ